jgi:uncharacterized protein
MKTARHFRVTGFGMLAVYLLANVPIARAVDDQPSFATLMQGANEGNAEAQFKVGQMFELSNAPSTAITWYVKAAEQKYEPAATRLFFIYGSTSGASQDFTESVKWAKVSAGLGNNLCQFALGVAYLEGTGVGKDPAQAAFWFRRAADGGRVEAKIALANLYASGTGISRNEAEAEKLYLNAYSSGSVEAAHDLGKMYLAEPAPDRTKAIEWLHRAADRGFLAAQDSLYGVFDSYSDSELKSAMDGGDKEAAFVFGRRLMKGDPAAALRIFLASANDGPALLQFTIGLMYLNGTGTAANPAEGMGWIRMARNQGFEPAKQMVGP